MKESLEISSLFFEQAGDGLFLVDASGRVFQANAQARFLCQRKDLTGHALSDLLRAESPSRALDLQSAYTSATVFHSQEGFSLKQGDDWLPVNVTVSGGGTAVVLVSVRDISHRQHLENSLRLSESRQQTLLDNLSQSVFVKDRDFRFVAVNRSFCAGLGQPPENVLGQDDYHFYPRVLADKYRTDDSRILAERTRLETDEQNLQGGQIRTVRVVKTPIHGPGGEPAGILGIFWDVTEQNLLEAQLRQAQKMEAVGQLAGGIAHDFNNLLAAILGNLALAKSEFLRADPQETFELLEQAEKAGQRAADLIRQLLGFARRIEPKPEPLDVNSLIQAGLANWQASLDPPIELDLRLAPNLFRVEADGGQLQQVLLILCSNAREAMPTGGTVTIETAWQSLTEDDLTHRADKEHLGLGQAHTGDFIRLRVQDSGTGISTAVLPHLYEPFFSTKDIGQGTGLALSMAYGIVKEHEGWIDCRSVVGQGTTFDVFLPCQQKKRRTPDRGEPPRGKETLLLADDHEMVRRLGQDMLENCGYRVLTAPNGIEAVEMFRQHKDEIALIVVDMTLPRRNGHQAIHQIRQINPKVKVLLSAAFPTGPALHAVEILSAAGFVAKPFHLQELAQAVRAALDRTLCGK